MTSTASRTSSKAKAKADRRSRLEHTHIDIPFFSLVLLLLGVGLITMLSASFPYGVYKEHDALYFFKRQAIFTVIGIAAMLFVSFLDHKFFRKWSRPLLIASFFLLILVLVPSIGILRNNARRWLGVPGIEALTFQPSEIAKFAIVLYFSDHLARRRRPMEPGRRSDLFDFVMYLVILGFTAGLMLKEPHFSGTILIVTTGFILLFISGIPWRWVITVLGLGVAGASVFIGVLGYGASRISMWLNPWQDMKGDGYQMCQSFITIGSGGAFGLGIGRSRQKYMYLPEQRNDFIFSVYCEEVGFVGAILLLLLFTLLILRGFWIAFHAQGRFGFYLVCGIMTLFSLQVFLNVAVVTGLVPCTGISLPFFSYGGTALTMQLAEMGVVLSVSRHTRPSRAE